MPVCMAIAGNIGIHQMFEPKLAHFSDKLFGGNARALTPTSYGNLTVLRVDARREHVGILGKSSFSEFGVGYQRSAQHHTRNTGFSQAIDGFKAANTATHFDLQTGFLDNALDDIDVFRHATSSAIEIDHVDPTRTLLLEKSCLGHWVRRCIRLPRCSRPLPGEPLCRPKYQ